MLLLNINTQAITIQSDRFKVIIDHKQVRVIDEVAKETTVIDAKAFKAPGSPDALPFEWLPDVFKNDFMATLADNNRLGLDRDQISGYIAGWVRRGHLINNNGTYSKTGVVSL